MINNFKLIEPLIQFTNPGDCYFVQLLKRQKDNPTMTRNMVNVDNFFIYSLDEYRSMEQKIIEISNIHNARAYIRVNRRNTETLALNTLVKVSNLILSKDYKAIKNAYLSAAGEKSSEPVKRWIVDLDKNAMNSGYEWVWKSFTNDIRTRIHTLHHECNRNSNQPKYTQILEIPTKNGLHIITNPFNLQKFREDDSQTMREQLEQIDIHKDNPTILYIP